MQLSVRLKLDVFFLFLSQTPLKAGLLVQNTVSLQCAACMDVKTDGPFIARIERHVSVTDVKTLCNSKPSVCTHPEGHHMLES